METTTYLVKFHVKTNVFGRPAEMDTEFAISLDHEPKFPEDNELVTAKLRKMLDTHLDENDTLEPLSARSLTSVYEAKAEEYRKQREATL